MTDAPVVLHSIEHQRQLPPPKVLLWAFLIQLLFVVAGLVAILNIYRGFKRELNSALALQRTQAAELAQKEKDLDDAQNSLATSYFWSGLRLIQAERYVDASNTLRDGLRVKPDDAYIRGALIRSLIKAGDTKGASEVANTLPQHHPMMGLDYLNLAVASCGSHDYASAAAAVRHSGLDPSSDRDVKLFCPENLLSQH